MWDSGIIATVAANVRRVRNELDLSQEELAFEAKVDRTYISLVERRKRNITISMLARLAKALKVKPAELVETTAKRRP
jgi:transcriptional regulator with XRE-family HTH domain